jgi:D-arabinose 1-dehydrogenase-like Zn-dependent alcohol dehydrogenase
LIKPCGKLLQVGAPAVSTNMAYGFFPLIIKQIEIIGSLVGSISETREMLEVAAKHNVKVIAEIFSFEEFPAALHKLEHGKPIFRCVVNVEDYAKKHNL